MEFEEVRYGLLMMVLCDREGRIYDVWISFGSMHEVRAFRERKRRSLWFWELVENSVVYGDRGYRDCEGVIVCDAAFFKNRPVAVIGEDDYALEETECIARFANKIYLVVPSSKIKAPPEMVSEIQFNPKVEILLHQRLLLWLFL